MPGFDAVVLAGGASSRLGGHDKAQVRVGGLPMLDRVLAAVADARRIVVVGPRRELAAGVVQVREQPAGGGPVAALAAGLVEATADVVVVVACDLPFLEPRHVASLVATLVSSETDMARIVDASGRGQYLTAAYRRGSLVSAMAALTEIPGASMHALTDRLSAVDIPGDGAIVDCDTWADVEKSRAIMENR